MTNKIKAKLKHWFKRPIIGGENSKISRKVTIKTALTLEDNVLILEGTSISGHEVSIGRFTGIMHDVEIVGPVKIGRYCAIARQALFQGMNHYSNWAGLQFRFYRLLIEKKLPFVKKGTIEIGNSVWIGSRAIILAGVKIGDGAIIGAGSVVTKDVEPYSITVGNPAVHKKYRFTEEVRKQLLKIKWWDWSYEKIKNNKKFFTTDLTTVKKLKPLIVD